MSKKYLCPLCGAEVIVIWSEHPYFTILQDEEIGHKSYAVRCSNDECRPVSVKVFGNMEKTFALMRGYITYCKDSMTEDLFDAMEDDIKKNFVKKVSEEYVDKG